MANEKGRQEYFRMCPHCGERNPHTAVACLHCYKDMRPPQLPWWRRHFKIQWPIGALLVFVALFAIYKVKKLLDNMEAQISMNIRGEDYNVSVVADKKRKEVDIDVDPVEKPVP